MSPEPSPNPRGKLDRAHEHLRVLDTETAAFYKGNAVEGKPYEIESEFRADASEYVFTIKVLRQPPAALSLILGDYLHNLRSALDHLVCRLAVSNGNPEACESTQFPVSKTSGNFASVAPDWLAGLKSTQRAIIEREQPYHAGQRAGHHALRLIHDLDNFDKHRAIHPAFGFFTDPGRSGAAALRFTPNRDAGTVRDGEIANGRRIEGDTEIVRLKLAPLGPSPKVDMHGDLTFEPAFGDDWFKGVRLPQLARYVETVFTKFGV